VNQKHFLFTSAATLLAVSTSSCAPKVITAIERPPAPVQAAPQPTEKEVTSVIVGGESALPPAPRAKRKPAAAGNIELNVPGVDVRTLAQIVLRDTLHIPYSIAVSSDVSLSLATAGPVSRARLLELFEAALKDVDLAMVWQGSGYRIMPVSEAEASGTTFLAEKGFGTEVVSLKFVSSEELRKLLDKVVPGIVQSTDADRNVLTIAGTSGQRSSARDIIAQFDVNWLRSMSFALLVPQRTDSRLIVPELDKLINAADAPTRGLVRLIAMDQLNGIIAVSAQRQYLEDVRRWVEILDREGTNNEARLFVYRVQNSRASDLVKTINSAFGVSANRYDRSSETDGTPSRMSSDGGASPAQASRDSASGANRNATENGAGDRAEGGMRIRVSSDEVNNAVVVFSSPHDYSIIEDALRKLDVVPTQVMIEAAITEVSLTDDLRYGVQWNFQTGQSNFALSQSTDGRPSRILPGFSYFYSNAKDISAALNALEQRTNIKVVSAPKLLVLNNQTASLQVGDQVPVSTQSAVSTQGGSAPIVNSVEYRDTGVILKITPRVNASGTVLLDVAQEVSDVAQTRTSTINSPTISTRRVSTSVAVQDGQVIALGGLFRDSNSFGKNGLPLISRIPILGTLLFGNGVKTQNRTELIVLIKAHVLRTASDLHDVTEELRSKIRTIEPFRTKGRMP